MSNQNNKIAISFHDVVKRFPGMSVNAVNHVSLDISDGEFVTVLGTSGSGKTTLVKMVNQLYDITEGDILFYGQSLKELNPVEQRRKIGYVVQNGGLFPHMTVEDNIAVVPNILKWEKRKISERVDELLEMLELDPKVYRKRFPRQLSGGQQQRVGIARAMAVDPNVMLMDEPFGAIDAITRETLQKELHRLHQKMHKTILFVTHDIHEAFLLGDKIIIMNQGNLQQYDTADNIMLHPANTFVAKLVSADNPMERVKNIRTKTIMQPVSEEISGTPRILFEDASVEEAMLILMQNPKQVIYVKDAGDNIVGCLKWNDVERLLH